MKLSRLVVVFLACCLLLPSYSSVNASNESDDSLYESTKRSYSKRVINEVILHVNTEGEWADGVSYTSKYVPIMDVFGGHVDEIKWDRKSKIATILNEDKEMVLNFSGKALESSPNQVEIPTDWIRLENGRPLIDVAFLSYILTPTIYTSDKEREKWHDALSFLRIEVTGDYNYEDGYLQIYVAHESDNFFYRATHTYYGDEVILHRIHEGKISKTTYDSSFIPIKDIFSGHVDAIKWDGESKVTTIKNQGKEAVLNFSGKPVEGTDNQVILPTEWIRLENGRALINAAVLCYIFDPAAVIFDDKQRSEWVDKLSFLGINTDGIYSATDGYLQVFLKYTEEAQNDEK